MQTRARFVVLFLLLLTLVACQNQSAPTWVSEPQLAGPRVAPTPVSTQEQPKPLPNAPARTDKTAPGTLNEARNWAPSARLHNWKWIVIHHSDTATGSAASFDRYHRTVNHWDELGYHFVIGNGTGSADGLVEVGPRWRKQKIGAHAGVLQYNEYGVGICLVGNFDQTRPTPAQIRATAQLTAYLMRTCNIPASRVIGHRDCGRKTGCPGRNMDISLIRRLAAQYASAESTHSIAVACAELLFDAAQ